jgi:hypothetical protein
LDSAGKDALLYRSDLLDWLAVLRADRFRGIEWECPGFFRCGGAQCGRDGHQRRDLDRPHDRQREGRRLCAHSLPPGNYTLTAEAPGFSKLEQTGIILQINQQARVDLTLQVGQTAQTIQVTGHPPLLEAESSSVGTVINRQLVNELPLNGRNFVQLATLSPGVNGVGESASGTIMGGTRPDDRRAGSEIFSNGNREGDNNFLFDGVDNNERLTLSITLRPAVDAVREFKIQTNLYSADVGRNSGAVIDVISKSGTNQLHGSLFEFLRNSDVDARTYFNTAGTEFPHLPLESIWRLSGRTRGHPQGLPWQR